ncbi:hypothetical protein OG568_48170 [Streptomyces sp. NBC_01450]|uniref:hypothetical protein n=1 Tax=Streptomyces sp. NBC_01450 TaxID=2903871 RepID=UPI002E34B7A7|nr:hypothetical protein [Streptomyces sp. NBC_01450]
MANTNDGLASAPARGRVGGRRPKLTADQAPLAQRLYDERGKTVQQIADMVGVPRIRPQEQRRRYRRSRIRRSP